MLPSNHPIGNEFIIANYIIELLSDESTATIRGFDGLIVRTLLSVDGEQPDWGENSMCYATRCVANRSHVTRYVT